MPTVEEIFRCAKRDLIVYKKNNNQAGNTAGQNNQAVNQAANTSGQNAATVREVDEKETNRMKRLRLVC